MSDEGLPINKRLLEILALNPEEVYRSNDVKKLKENLKTEKANEQLQDHSKEMITEIEEFEKKCIKSYLANEKATNEFKKTKQIMKAFNHKWNEYFRQSTFSEEKVSEAIAKVNDLAIKTNWIWPN